MKKPVIVLLLLFAACNSNEKAPAEKDKPVINKEDAVRRARSNISQDSLFAALSRQVLTFVKRKDYTQFTAFFHPVTGVRFSPYGYTDTAHDVVLTSISFLEAQKKRTLISWGSYDGSGSAISLSIESYFQKFVYDADFLQAPKIAVNKMIGAGNSLNNLEAVYPGCDFIEFHFPGFDKKYEGMDWKSLRLVFKSYNSKPYLIAVIHDQWTI